MINLEGRRKAIKYLVFGPIIIFLAILIFFYIKNSPERAAATRFIPLTIGDEAPDFSLHTLAGKTVRLSSLRGKVVLINIWATWCPTCLEEMPQLQRLYDDLKDHEDFQLLTISIDALGAQVVKPFLEKHKLDFPTLLDPKGSIKKIYNTTGVPESFIINQKGLIVDKVIGPRDWSGSEVERFFGTLMEKGKNPFDHG